MSASPVVIGIPGVRHCIVADGEGRVLEQHSAPGQGQQVATLATSLGQQLEQVAAILGLGATDVVTAKGENASWVFAYGTNASISVEVDPSRSPGNVEAALKSSDWPSLIEWAVSDSDIEYLPGEKAAKAKIGREQQSPSKPRVTGGAGALRRALVKGQLALAAEIGAASTAELGDPEQLSHALPPLLEGIGSVLAGEQRAGLEQLELSAKASTRMPSLLWAASIWSARAKLGSDGLGAAMQFAVAAASAAEALDAEARSISILLVAEIAFQEAEFDRALQLLHDARGLFSSLALDLEHAKCWLLAARTLSAMGHHDESKQAAEHARQHRPKWLPPVLFIANAALNAGQVGEAEKALELLMAKNPSPEASQVESLLRQVRASAVPPRAAAEYLRLLDAPATRESIRQLEELAESFPRIEQFRDALGWKLIRAGDFDAAQVVFERLSARGDLSAPAKVSVLLAIGCLTVLREGNQPIARSLLAAVQTAPRHLQNGEARPPRAPSESAEPLEFGCFERAPSMTPVFLADESKTLPRRVRGGPVFSGNLELFALPDLLEFLRSSRRTGTLVCSSVAGIGAVHLRHGKITGAYSPGTQRLKDYLLSSKAVTAEQLQSIGQVQQNARPRPLIGTVLVRAGIVTVEQVRDALSQQIEDAIAELITWGEGRFAFNPEAVATGNSSDVEVEIDPQATLLRIFKLVDEGSDASS